MVQQRIVREYAVQLVSFVVTLIDRVLVAAILVRVWDIPDFAAWTVAMSVAGMVGVFNFGANLYFSNQLMFKVQTGDRGGARRMLLGGNSFMLAAALTGAFAAVMMIIMGKEQVGSVEVTQRLVLATLCLIGVAALPMASAAQLSLYRAHGQYARQTMLVMLGDLGKIIVTIFGVLAGFDFLLVAMGQLAITAAVLAYTIFKDQPDRFPDLKLQYGLLRGSEFKHGVRTSMGYWMATAPSALLTYLPVFLLTSIQATSFAIAQFALIRTVSSFVRTVLQQFSIVLAQEIARRLAVGDKAGMAQTYRESALLLTVQTAVAAGVVSVTGAGLFSLWTGRDDIYDDWLLWLSLAPIVAIPAMTLAQNFFASANMPRSLAIGRLVQLILTFVLFYLLPIEDGVLKLIIVLGLAEIIGLGLPVLLAIARVLDGAGLFFNIALLLRGLACLAAVALPCTFLQRLLDQPAVIKLAILLLLGALLSALVLLFAGLERARRAHVLARLREIAALLLDRSKSDSKV